MIHFVFILFIEIRFLVHYVVIQFVEYLVNTGQYVFLEV